MGLYEFQDITVGILDSGVWLRDGGIFKNLFITLHPDFPTSEREEGAGGDIVDWIVVSQVMRKPFCVCLGLDI